MKLALKIAGVFLGIIAAGLMLGGPTALAVTVLGTEDPVNGLTVTFPPGFNDQGILASDGEAPFHPFGATFDVSDAVQFFSDHPWTPDPSHAAAFAPGFWQQVVDPNHPTANTWVLPAATPCGLENEPACEPIAKWFINSEIWVIPTPQTWVMLEPGGAVSDTFTIANDGPSGFATLTFASDSLPEPASLALLGSGLVAVAWLARRRRAS